MRQAFQTWLGRRRQAGACAIRKNERPASPTPFGPRTLKPKAAFPSLLSAAIFLACAGASTVQARDVPRVFGPQEPGYEVIKSGACRVAVCTDFNFGDVKFRAYSDGRPYTINLIPRGACQCERVKEAGKEFSGTFSFGIQLESGVRYPDLLLNRVGWERLRADTFRQANPGRPEPTNPTSKLIGEIVAQTFERVRGALEPVPAGEFSWRGDTLSSFAVWQSKPPTYGQGSRIYFAIPKNPAQIDFGGRSQAVAFQTILVTNFALDINDPKLSASLLYCNSVMFSAGFDPKFAPSDQWIADLRWIAEYIEGRLTPQGTCK